MKKMAEKWRTDVTVSYEEKLNDLKLHYERENEIRTQDHKAQILEQTKTIEGLTGELKRQERERENCSQIEATILVKDQVIQDLSEQVVDLRVRLQQFDNEAQTLRRTVGNLAEEKKSLEQHLDIMRATIDEKEKASQFIAGEIGNIKVDYGKRFEQLKQTLRDEHTQDVANLKANLQDAAKALVALEREVHERKRESEERAFAIKSLITEKENMRSLSEQRLKKLTAIGTVLNDN